MSARHRAIRVAVIGAGISGLIAARTLQEAGLSVTVFDKGRGVGGRMSTRRTDKGFSFDHGAQYFTARDQRFQSHVDSWMQQGVVKQWPNPSVDSNQKIVVLKDGVVASESKSQTRYVGTPGMTAIAKHLAEGIDVRLQTRISQMSRSQRGNQLFADQENVGGFDHVVLSAPAGQAADLLVEFPELESQVRPIEMNPCWATMVGLEAKLNCEWVGAFVHDSFLTWAARNGTKPDRSGGGEQLLLHAGNEWTKANWESDPESVADAMLAEFWRISGLTPVAPNHLQSHRWKFAIPVNPDAIQNHGCLSDLDAGISVCGDWANGSRVEGAFLSGLAAANAILGSLK